MAGRFDFGYRPNLSVSSPLHAANAMVQNNNSEVNESSPNVQKLAPINDVLNKCSNSSMLLRVKKLSKKAVLPSRAVALSCGYNLYSAMETKVPAQGKVLVPTDLSIAIPEGTYARIVSLSKLTLKHAISVGAGVIDADYRGPVGLILFNHSDVDFEVRVGDRIAQVILPKIPTPNVLEGKDLGSTVGIEGGFGSIGGYTAMVQKYNSEAHEPLSKVPKLAHMNDVLNKCSNSSMLLRVEKLSEKAVLPLRASALSAGYDLSSAMETKVPARGKVLVSTDLSIAIPEGTYARIAPRSGLALKHAIHVGEGVIDADYRGPVGVILFNHSDVDFEVKVGDRIAQLILETIATPNVLEGEDLDSTVRGEGDFGFTAMAQNYNLEANELLPKVPKLAHMNGVLNKCSNSSMLLRVEKLSEKAVLPLRPSALSAGYDLSSAMETKVPARGRVMVPIDLSIAIPEGTYARIASRSGLGLKHAIEVGAGMIDADYIGPIGVILFNHSDVDFEVKVGDRIAQLILEKIATLNVLEVEDLDSTVRGEGGFGSTGL